MDEILMSAAAETLSPSSATREFLAREHKLFIGGEWRDASGSERTDIIDPATEAVLTTAAVGTPADVDAAVIAAEAAFKGEWSTISSHDRGKLLLKLADEIDANLPMLAELETLDNGMPLMIAQYSVGKFGADFMRYYAGWPAKIHGLTIPVSPADATNGESLSYTRKEPLGVVGAIIPWNAPFCMVILKLAPALAAGCTIVIKPAELTPLTALALCDLANKAGIPPGVLNIITGHGREAGAALSVHPKVKKIAFTGSTEVGLQILGDAGSDLKKVTLELGGKSPVVVFADADIEKVVPGIARAAFFLQGQNCMAGTRLYVHEDIYEQVIKGVADFVNTWKLGPGLDPTSMMGPLISADQRETVMGYIKAGKDAGAKVICGGEALEGKGFFVQPTIFGDTTNDMKVVQEEIFGPVLCAQSFSGDLSLEQVAELANDSIYGLSGSVWTQNISVAHKMAALIDSGQVSINCHAAVDAAIPFGGNKMSGWGREFGQEGLEPYLKTKATTVLF
jgi:phenylacetaldehyde dehydrogenase